MWPLDCDTQATMENLFFTMPIRKLRIFGGYISVIGTSTEVKIQVTSIYTHLLISQINKVRKFILIRYENTF